HLAAHGLRITPKTSEPDLDYQKLVPLCMDISPDAPSEFQTALFFINAMGSPARREEIEAEANYRGVTIATHPGCTDHDYAMLTWLQYPDLLEQAYARAAMHQRRTFTYFTVPDDEIKTFKLPTQEQCIRAEKDINLWFSSSDCGIGAKLIVYPGDPETWFLIRHGEKPNRMPAVDEHGQGFSFFFRPEKYDVVIYNSRYGELKINAGKRLQDDYRYKFGGLLFERAYIFGKRALFTLDPLRTNNPAAISWGAAPEIQSVKLTEVRYELPGSHGTTVTVKSKDLYAEQRPDKPIIPGNAILVREARFDVKFRDSKAARSVVIKEGNVASYSCESDSAALEVWMRDRRFIRSWREQGDAKAA
ncbi:MAG: hypothetical protein JXB04_11380, partial [Kiritimatiellae bacterium]|nr:hypothetical protein [Kiritimatiellia bacterium]